MNRNAFASYFKALEKLGEPVKLQYFRQKSSKSGCNWIEKHELSHTQFDGVTGFIELLRHSGHLTEEAVPRRNPEREEDSLFQAVREAWRIRKNYPLQPAAFA